MARTHTFLVLLPLFACGGGNSANRPAADTTSAFSTLTPTTPVDSTLRILVSSDAKAYANGRAVTLPDLDSLLGALALIKGDVWYYRAQREPLRAEQQDSLADSVLTAITRHDLQVRVAKRPDFSDQEGKRRHPSDRP